MSECEEDLKNLEEDMESDNLPQDLRKTTEEFLEVRCIAYCRLMYSSIIILYAQNILYSKQEQN